MRASDYLAATAAVDGETVLSAAPSQSGVWVVEGERFAVRLSFSPDTIAQTTRSEWDAYVRDWGIDRANRWLAYVTSLLWPKQLSVTIVNKSSRPVTVVWEESAIISADGRSSRVIKSGVRFSEMDNPISPTSIPPGARIDDVIAPVDRISYSEARREWVQDSILRASDVGRALSVFLALEVDGDKSYISLDLDVVERIQPFAD